MRTHKTAAAFALTALFAASAASLEIKEGLVKLVASESTGRVTVYRLIDVAKDRSEPLMFEQDPRTSLVTLSVDGRHVKLGDSSEYRFQVSRTDGGIRIEYRSASCVVRQTYDFVKSSGQALADGVLVGIELENVSERESMLGLRVLIDTWLGEKSDVHFKTAKAERINVETALGPGSDSSWVCTPGERASFMVQFTGEGVAGPDKVLLSNWKRLADTTWGYDANPQRNFTLIPYSINDSAVALFWEPVAVSRGGTRKLSFFMGSFNELGYRAPEGKTKTEEIFEATVLAPEKPDAATSIAADLIAVRDLISRIDRSLAVGGDISDQELDAWKKILDRLEERKKGY
jgi:hypothetical protein